MQGSDNRTTEWYIGQLNKASSESKGFIEDKLQNYNIEQLQNIHSAAIENIKINSSGKVSSAFFFSDSLDMMADKPQTYVAASDTLVGRGTIERDRLYKVLNESGLEDEQLSANYKNLVQKLYLKTKEQPFPRNDTKDVNSFITSEENVEVVKKALKEPETFNKVMEILDDKDLRLADAGAKPDKLMKMVCASMKSDDPIAMANGIKEEFKELNKELEGKWIGKVNARNKLADEIYNGQKEVKPISLDKEEERPRSQSEPIPVRNEASMGDARQRASTELPPTDSIYADLNLVREGAGILRDEEVKTQTQPQIQVQEAVQEKPDPEKGFFARNAGRIAVAAFAVVAVAGLVAATVATGGVAGLVAAGGAAFSSAALSGGLAMSANLATAAFVGTVGMATVGVVAAGAVSTKNIVQDALQHRGNEGVDLQSNEIEISAPQPQASAKQVEQQHFQQQQSEISTAPQAQSQQQYVDILRNVPQANTASEQYQSQHQDQYQALPSIEQLQQMRDESMQIGQQMAGSVKNVEQSQGASNNAPATPNARPQQNTQIGG